MNVAAHSFILANQRTAVEVRRERPNASPRAASLAPLRDAQKIAAARQIASEPERRERLVERRSARRLPDETPRSALRRDGDERGRLLDVYC